MARPTCGQLLRLGSEVCEIALASRGATEFRDRAGPLVCDRLGWDTAAFYHSRDGRRISARGACGPGGDILESRIDAFMAPVSREELGRAGCGRSVWDSDVFEERRRRELPLYSEYLAPWNVERFLARLWCQGRGAFWMTFARVGRLSPAHDHDLEAFDAIFPALAAGEALHAEGSDVQGDSGQLEWAREQKVTPSEFRVAALAGRGLTNPEIAELAGVSHNTVRNRLASVFQKLGVSTRAELAFVLQARPPSTAPHPRPVWTPLEHLVRSAQDRPLGQAGSASRAA